jgi:hypothetical protein
MTPSLQTGTDFLRSWLPWATVLGLLWRGWSKLKGRVTSFLDTLLDNHFAHAQASLDRMEQQQDRQIELLEKIAEK